MAQEQIQVSFPVEPRYARSMRLLAASLAVVAGMDVEQVDDVRMAVEEAFIYACATRPKTCTARFALDDKSLTVSFDLGDHEPDEDDEFYDSYIYAEMILNELCDEFSSCEPNSEEEGCAYLLLTKYVGESNAS